MRSKNVYIGKYDWIIRFYVKVTHIDAHKVLDSLYGIGCRGAQLAVAIQNLKESKLDSGLCYSNPESRISVIVISKTSSPDEFLDSLVHEITHWSVHVAKTLGIDIEGEEICYAAGDVARQLYPDVKDLLCCNCH